MKKTLITSFFLITILCSCASNILAPGHSFFQAMGNENCAVISVDNESTSNHRVSFELYDDSTFSGILELGNLPLAIIDAKIRQSERFAWQKGIIGYYKEKGSTLSLAVIDNGVVLFSNRNIEDAYERFILNRKENISKSDALKMSGSSYSFWKTDFESFDKVLICSEDLKTFDCFLVSETEEKASKFISLVKAKEIEKYRLSGIKPDYEDLAERIVIKGNEISLKAVSDFPELDLEAIVKKINVLMGDNYGI